jgi:glutamate synthase (NADPH/NADH) large chain/glutamate synthase (ferredoxin)
MTLDGYLGRQESLLSESPQHVHLLHVKTPLLMEAQLATLRQLEDPQFRSQTLPTTFAVADGPQALDARLDHLEQEAVTAIQQGISLLILSDREASLAQAPIPMVIAVGALHHALTKRGLRTHVALICETGTVCDIHQIALLLGYGAEAVVPTLAYTSVRALAGERRLEHLTREQAVDCYIQVVESGLRKVMARMGISTLSNIVGAGQYEVIGLAPEFVERCFTGSAFHPGKITLNHVAEQVIKQFQALQQEQAVPDTGKRRRKPSKLAVWNSIASSRRWSTNALRPCCVICSPSGPQHLFLWKKSNRWSRSGLALWSQRCRWARLAPRRIVRLPPR